MPKKGKKPFIDKKNSVTFRLVHRSQQDPFIADEQAPQHVLLEQKANQRGRRDDGRSTSQSVDRPIGKNLQEEHKYGIYFDDDYNYLQHLKDVGEVVLEPISGFDVYARPLRQHQVKEPTLKLPSSVFASNVEVEVGLLNKAAPLRGPQPNLDPDILAALDSDYDFSDSELDDDFVTLANQATGRLSEEDEEGRSHSSGNEGDSGDDDLCSLDGSQHTFGDEETKSRFTNYSMSSSVIRRGDGLTLLDDRFEKMYEGYDDDQIGALDCDNIDGYLQTGDLLLENVIEDYEKKKRKIGLEDLRKIGPFVEDDCYVSDDEEELVKMVIEEPTEKWDCESILSTYSTLYNHPKIISMPSNPRPIKVSSKTGIPLNVLSGRGLTAAALKSLDSQVVPSSDKSVISVCSLMRAKNETTAEKKIRKQMIKEHRRERRTERKATLLASKEEKKIQAVTLSSIQNKLKGIKF